MSDVLTVPGVETVHPRSAWQDPSWPITGPLCVWSDIRQGVAHYTAADDLIDGDPGEHASDLPGYLRAMQHSYAKPVGLGGRGYSVGYWWAVDWLGGAWQMRGWDLRSAANKGDRRKTGTSRNANGWTGPILFLVDGADRLTAEAAHTGRMLNAEMGRRAARDIGRPAPHSALDYTACCGDGIRLDIAAGLLDPTPDPQPPSGDDDMPITAYIAKPPPERAGGPHMVVVDGSIRYAGSEDGPDFPDQRVIRDPEQYDNYLRSAGLA